MATRRDRRAARAKPSAAALSRDLAASRERILGLEDRLAAACEKVFRQAGRIAAKKFKEKATAHAVTAAAPSPEGTMVAVYPTPEQAAALAQEGGEPAEILHVTLAYLGKTTPEQADAALAVVRDVASRQPASPLEGEVVGVSTFNPSEDDDGEPLYPSIALPDVPGLAELRRAVTEALDAAGISYSTDHEWTPHITISYEPEATPPPRELIGQPLTFEALTLARGDVPTHLPFGPAALAAAGEPPPWTPPDADEVVDVEAIVAGLRTKSDPIRRSAIREYGAALEGVVDWDVSNPLAQGVLAGSGQHVTHIAETTRLNVMRTIRASYEDGLSIPDTARAIQEGMSAASAARGRLIARTELAAVANGGSLAATQLFADATGDTLYKRWLTAPGAKEPRHEDYEGLDGQTVALDDTFDVGGFQLAYPGDPDGPPEEICNCRCSLIFVSDPAEVAAPTSVAEDSWAAGDEGLDQFVGTSPAAEDGLGNLLSGLPIERESDLGLSVLVTPTHQEGADWYVVRSFDQATGDWRRDEFPRNSGRAEAFLKRRLGEENQGRGAEWKGPRGQGLGNLEGRFGDFYRGLSDVERGAISRFTGDEYKELNRPLQLGMKVEGEKGLVVERVERVLANAPVLNMGVLYRGVREAKTVAVGDVVQLAKGGFQSTSLSESQAAVHGKVIYRITGPTRGLPIKPFSFVQEEDEVILPREQRFRVTGIREGKVTSIYGRELTKTIVDVEAVPLRGATAIGPLDLPLSASQEVKLSGPHGEAAYKAVESESMQVILDPARSPETQATLRSGDLTPELTADLKQVDTAIGGSVLDRGAISLRGVSDLRPMFASWPPKIGDVAYDPAYASTAIDPKLAARFAGEGPDSGYVTYHLAPGQNGLWVPDVLDMAQYDDFARQELLLPRGLPLRVIGIGEREGKLDVHVEIVGRPVTAAAADYSAEGIARVELLPPSGHSPYANTGAIVQNAARADAQVTAALRHAVELRGGYMEGLPFRVKSAPSVARKIEKIMRDDQVPLAAATTGIKDGLRFTAVFNPEDYVREVTATLDELKARAGIVPERISATWKPGVEYAGTNLVMRAPNGLRFELQFHTPQSFDVKERVNHALYQTQRRLQPGSPEWERLGSEMKANADAVVRPPGILEWKYEASVEADIGITPFRAAADDPFGFYDSERFKTFERHAEKIAGSYGVEIDAKLRVPSVWEGVEEPGVSIHAHDGEKGVAAFAADLGKVYDQDGVLLFSPTIGEDLIATFDRLPAEVDREKTLAAMKSAGLPGARFLEDGRLQIIGSGPEFVAQLDAVGRDLGVGYDSALGKFSLLEKEKGDYEAALRDFASAQGQPVRPTGGTLPEHGGAPALGPGAPGGQGGAEEVAGLARAPDAASAKTFDPAPLPHVPHYEAAEIKGMGDDELWGALAVNGKIDNLARADVTAKESARLRAEVWRRVELDRRFMEGVAPDPGLSVHFGALAGDNQTHTTFSDGHNTIREMALAARKRGATQIVVSDHAHLMSEADLRRQFRQIDKLNAELGPGFKILRGVEANILEDGTLDIAALPPELVSQFDVVNGAIHGTEALGGQQVLVPRSPTERYVAAIRGAPKMTVLVHPHALRADWDAVAKAAAERGVALEVNGRSLLRADSASEAGKMIEAAKRQGTKLAIGSDAHSTGDLIDAAYAARFAAEHGVRVEDIVEFQRPRGLSPMTNDPSTLIPGEVSLSSPDVKRLGVHSLNPVYLAEIDGETYVVKVPSASEFSGEQIRNNITPGNDVGRERAAYVMARYFNSVNPNIQVNVPVFRSGEAVDRAGEVREAAISKFVEGTVGLDWAPDYEQGLAEKQAETDAAAIFDSLIGNTDRHPGNFIFGDDGQLWLIDHGLAFPEDNDSAFYNSLILSHALLGPSGEELGSAELALLISLRDRWDEVESDLVGLLDDESMIAMKERLDYMIEGETRNAEGVNGGPFF